MPIPDRPARLSILDLYAGRIPNISPGVDLEELAKLTAGMSGADLSELVNQAGLTAQREQAAIAKAAAEEAGTVYVPSDDIDYEILSRHFTSALDSAEMGPERKSVQVAQRDRHVTCYHEAGHAIVAAAVGLKPRKVTIIPRGGAGGVTWATGGEEQLLTKKELYGRLRYFMGARAAERVRFGEDGYTTGASHDIEQATTLAEALVREYGMVEDYRANLPLTPGDPRAAVLHQLLREAEQEALVILKLNPNVLETLAAALEEKETIEGEALDVFFNSLQLPEVAA
jgi:cell division protease FtsH